MVTQSMITCGMVDAVVDSLEPTSRVGRAALLLGQPRGDDSAAPLDIDNANRKWEADAGDIPMPASVAAEVAKADSRPHCSEGRETKMKDVSALESAMEMQCREMQEEEQKSLDEMTLEELDSEASSLLSSIPGKAAAPPPAPPPAPPAPPAPPSRASSASEYLSASELDSDPTSPPRKDGAQGRAEQPQPWRPAPVQQAAQKWRSNSATGSRPSYQSVQAKDQEPGRAAGQKNGKELIYLFQWTKEAGIEWGNVRPQVNASLGPHFWRASARFHCGRHGGRGEPCDSRRCRW